MCLHLGHFLAHHAKKRVGLIPPGVPVDVVERIRNEPVRAGGDRLPDHRLELLARREAQVGVVAGDLAPRLVPVPVVRLRNVPHRTEAVHALFRDSRPAVRDVDAAPVVADRIRVHADHVVCRRKPPRMLRTVDDGVRRVVGVNRMDEVVELLQARKLRERRLVVRVPGEERRMVPHPLDMGAKLGQSLLLGFAPLLHPFRAGHVVLDVVDEHDAGVTAAIHRLLARIVAEYAVERPFDIRIDLLLRKSAGEHAEREERLAVHDCAVVFVYRHPARRRRGDSGEVERSLSQRLAVGGGEREGGAGRALLEPRNVHRNDRLVRGELVRLEREGLAVCAFEGEAGLQPFHRIRHYVHVQLDRKADLPLRRLVAVGRGDETADRLAAIGKEVEVVEEDPSFETLRQGDVEISVGTPHRRREPLVANPAAGVIGVVVDGDGGDSLANKLVLPREPAQRDLRLGIAFAPRSVALDPSTEAIARSGFDCQPLRNLARRRAFRRKRGGAAATGT